MYPSTALTSSVLNLGRGSDKEEIPTAQAQSSQVPYYPRDIYSKALPPLPSKSQESLNANLASISFPSFDLDKPRNSPSPEPIDEPEIVRELDTEALAALPHRQRGSILSLHQERLQRVASSAKMRYQGQYESVGSSAAEVDEDSKWAAIEKQAEEIRALAEKDWNFKPLNTIHPDFKPTFVRCNGLAMHPITPDDIAMIKEAGGMKEHGGHTEVQEKGKGKEKLQEHAVATSSTFEGKGKEKHQEHANFPVDSMNSKGMGEVQERAAAFGEPGIPKQKSMGRLRKGKDESGEHFTTSSDPAALKQKSTGGLRRSMSKLSQMFSKKSKSCTADCHEDTDDVTESASKDELGKKRDT